MEARALPLTGPALILCIFLLPLVNVNCAPLSDDNTELEYYPVADSTGCYYNFQHYDEGDRIITNEPCLNCTCHNRMLMCYLRVCPFTKAIGQDCKVEKRPDQCCPVITCPEVPVQLLPSTTQSSTELGHLDAYGCSIDNLFYSDGARVPSDPTKPCELCYCIRNKTACVMQECTLQVEGCRPVHQEGVCCPVRYDCDHPEYPLLETTTNPAPLLTTTTPGPIDCIYNNDIYADGALILKEKEIPCEHCYCMRGDIVCAVQECGPTPLDKVNCTALPPPEGECCTTTYDCEHVIEEELTTLSYLDTPTTPLSADVSAIVPSEEPSKPEEEVKTTQEPIEETKSPIEHITELIISEETETPGLHDGHEGHIDEGEHISPVSKEPTATEQPQVYTEPQPTEKLPESHITELPEIQPVETETPLYASEKPIETTEPSIATEFPPRLAETKPSVYSTEKSAETPETSSMTPIEEHPHVTESITEKEPETTTLQPEKEENIPEVITPIPSEKEKETIPTGEQITERLPDKPTTTRPELITEKVQEHIPSASAHPELITEKPIRDEQATEKIPEEHDTKRPELETSSEYIPVESTEKTPHTEKGIYEGSGEETTEEPIISETEQPKFESEMTTHIAKISESTSLKESKPEVTEATIVEETKVPESSTEVTREASIEKGTTLPSIQTTEPELKPTEKEEEIVTEEVEEATTIEVIKTPEITTIKSSIIPEVHTEAEVKIGTEKTIITTSLPQEEITTKEESVHVEITTMPTVHTETPHKVETEGEPEGEEEDHRIPGEGSCLVDGQTYKNNSQVPPINQCQTFCKCVSSILQCESIACSPPPAHMQNCVPIFQPTDSCCPTYSCSGEEVTIMESDSHMKETTPAGIQEEITTKKDYIPKATTTVIPKEIAPEVTEPEISTKYQLPAEIPGETITEKPATEFELVASTVKTEVTTIPSIDTTKKLELTTELINKGEITTKIVELPETTEVPEFTTELITESKKETEPGTIPEYVTKAHEETTIEETTVSLGDRIKETGTEKQDTFILTTILPKITKPTESTINTTKKEDVQTLPETATTEIISTITQQADIEKSKVTEQPIESKPTEETKEETRQTESVTDEIKEEVTEFTTTHILEIATQKVPEVSTEKQHEIEKPTETGVKEETTESLETEGPIFVTKSEEETEKVTEYNKPEEKLESTTEEMKEGEIKGTELTTSSQKDTYGPEHITELQTLSSVTQQTPKYVSEEVTTQRIISEPHTEKEKETEIPEEVTEIITREAETVTPEYSPSKTTVTKGTTEASIKELSTITEMHKEEELSTEGIKETSGEPETSKITTSTIEKEELSTEAIATEKVATEKIVTEAIEEMGHGPMIHDGEEGGEHETEIPELTTVKIVESSKVTVEPAEKVTSTETSTEKITVSSEAPIPEILKTTIKEAAITEIPISQPVTKGSFTEKPTTITEKPETQPIETTTFQQPIEPEIVTKVVEPERMPESVAHVTETPTEPTTTLPYKPLETLQPETESAVTEEHKVPTEAITEETKPATETVTESVKPLKPGLTYLPVEGTTQPKSELEISTLPTEAQTEAGESKLTETTVSEITDKIKDIIPEATKEPTAELTTEAVHKATIPETETVKIEEEKVTQMPSKPEITSKLPETTEKGTADTGKLPQTTVEHEMSTEKEHRPELTTETIKKEKPETTTTIPEDLTKLPSGIEHIPTDDIEKESEKPELITQLPVETTKLPEYLPDTTVGSQEHRPEEGTTKAEQKPEIITTELPLVETKLPETPEEHITEITKESETTTKTTESTEHVTEELPEGIPEKEPELTTKSEAELKPETEQPIVTTVSSVPDDTHAEPSKPETEVEKEKKQPVTEVPLETTTLTEEHITEAEVTQKPVEVTTTEVEKTSEDIRTKLPEIITLPPKEEPASTIVPQTIEPEFATKKIPQEEEKVTSKGEHVTEKLPTEQTHIETESPITPATEATTKREEILTTPSIPGEGTEAETEKPAPYTSGPFAEGESTMKSIAGELSTSPTVRTTSTTTPVPLTEEYPTPGADYEEEEQSAFGPGTCRYGGKVYVSAQQIPRDDPCDFCFCFRSDIICLQQSCPPPIPRCHEEPIRGFCCPRYECPVSMATAVNVTTTTTTTTTTLPPHFLSHAYRGRASRTGCQIQNRAYKVGEEIKSASGPCLHCTCGGNGQMKCDPKACSPEPMLRQMIAAAVSRRRR